MTSKGADDNLKAIVFYIVLIVFIYVVFYSILCIVLYIYGILKFSFLGQCSLVHLLVHHTTIIYPYHRLKYAVWKFISSGGSSLEVSKWGFEFNAVGV